MKKPKAGLKFRNKPIRHYLDSCIKYWRSERDKAETPGDRSRAVYYVDAFQSVRTSIFGETLPVDAG